MALRESKVIWKHYDDVFEVLNSYREVLTSLSERFCELGLIDVEAKNVICSESSGELGPKLLLVHLHMKIKQSKDYLSLVLDVLKKEEALSHISLDVDFLVSTAECYDEAFEGSPQDVNSLGGPATGTQAFANTMNLSRAALNLKEAFQALMFLLTTAISRANIGLAWLQLLITPLFYAANTVDTKSYLTELDSNLGSPVDIVMFLTNKNLLGHLNIEILNIFRHIVVHEEFRQKLDEYKTQYNSFICGSLNSIAEVFKEMPTLAPDSILDLPEIHCELQQPWKQKSLCQWKKAMQSVVSWSEYVLLRNIHIDSQKNTVIISYCVLPFIVSSVCRDLSNEVCIESFSSAGAKVSIDTKSLQDQNVLSSLERMDSTALLKGEEGFEMQQPLQESTEPKPNGTKIALGSSRSSPEGNSIAQETTMPNKSDSQTTVYSSTSNSEGSGSSDTQDVTIEVNPSYIKNIIRKTSTQVQVTILPVLIILGGLPQSGKSAFLNQILETKPSKHSLDVTQHTIAASGLKSRKLSCHGVHHLTSHLYSFLSGILYFFRIEGIEPIYNYKYEKKVFESSILNSNTEELLNEMRNFGKSKNRSEDEIKFERALPKGLAVAPIWELTVNRTVLRLLECFRGHLFNSHIWLFIDLDRDIDKLYLPPEKASEDLPSAMKWRSRLHYLLRSVCLSESCHTNRKKVCRLFAIYTSASKLGDNLKQLREEAENAAAQYGLSELIDFEVTPLDVSSKKSQREGFQILLQFLKKLEPQQIPLSWPFLRSALSLQQSIFMPYSELKELASECNVDLIRFLGFYTSFGSILNVKLVDEKSEYVIIDPAEFLRKMSDMFSVELTSSKYGIFTRSSARATLGEDYDKFFDVLISVGLASKVSRDRLCGNLEEIELEADEQFVYYMSVVRRGESDEQWMPKAIQLYTGLMSPAMNMQIAFTNQMLSLLPEAFLVTCEQLNVTCIEVRKERGNFGVKFVVQADVVEMRLEPNTSIEDMDIVCSTIVEAAHNIAELRSKRGGEFRYNFRFICTKEEQRFSSRIHKKYHVISDKLLKDCIECDDEINGIHVYQHFKIALENRPIEKFKLNEDISPNDAMVIADQLNKHDIVAFSMLLSQAVQIDTNSEEPLSWQVSRLILEWKKTNKDYPRRALVKLLLEAAATSDNNLKLVQEQKDRFKQIARKLDIQLYSSHMQHDQ